MGNPPAARHRCWKLAGLGDGDRLRPALRQRHQLPVGHHGFQQARATFAREVLKPFDAAVRPKHGPRDLVRVQHPPNLNGELLNSKRLLQEVRPWIQPARHAGVQPKENDVS